MLVRILSVFALLSALASTGQAATLAKTPRRVPSQGAVNFPDDSISIITESLSATSGHDDDRIAELARAYAAAGLPRVLPVAGLGPIANARDLLHMRGIDLAVIDSDIVAYAGIDGTLPGVTTHLHQVLKLGEKTVYVIAAKDVQSFADLAKQKVLALGEDSDGHVTARTLFSLLGIEVSLGSSDLEAATQALETQSAKALIMVGATGENVLARLPRNKGLHLLAVPTSDAIEKIYARTTVAAAEAAGLAPAGGIASVKVASLLATYAWKPNVYRHGPVQQFLKALPSVLVSLRANDPSGFWQAVDAHASLPGWQTYEGAASALVAVPPAAAALPAIATAIATPTTTAPTPALPATTSQAIAVPSKLANAPIKAPASTPVAPLTGGIELVSHSLAGLSDPNLPGGGVIAELVRLSLDGEQFRQSWAANEAEAARKVQDGSGARLGVAWQRPDCSSPAEKSNCDLFVYSKPLFQALDVFFVRHGSDFSFQKDDDVAGHSVCAAADADTSALDSPARGWLKQDMITLRRKPALADCLAALDHGDVDAVLGDQLAGQERIESAGLDGRIGIVDRPVAVRELVVAAAKSDPGAAQLITRLDAGLAALKADGRFADLVLNRLRHTRLSASDKVLR